MLKSAKETGGLIVWMTALIPMLITAAALPIAIWFISITDSQISDAAERAITSSLKVLDYNENDTMTYTGPCTGLPPRTTCAFTQANNTLNQIFKQTINAENLGTYLKNPNLAATDTGADKFWDIPTATIFEGRWYPPEYTGSIPSDCVTENGQATTTLPCFVPNGTAYNGTWRAIGIDITVSTDFSFPFLLLATGEKSNRMSRRLYAISALSTSGMPVLVLAPKTKRVG
ncbi:MAG: hypothetical protein R3A13_06895 [Bdellovibrionota bacterium]